MKKFLIILSATIISSTLFWSGSFLFSGLDRHYKIMKNAFQSATIDLGQKHVFKWKIAETDWPSNYGFFNLFLEFKRTPEIEEKDLWEKNFDLKVRIAAYAITRNNIRTPRLIENFFFPTDEPIRNKSNLWAGWSDEKMELLIGKIMRFPKEELFIELTIQQPDEVLKKAAPMLKLIGDYDPAAIGYIPIFRLLRAIVIFVCILGLLFITFHALKKT